LTALRLLPLPAAWHAQWEGSAESVYAAVTQYYDLSALSLRDALMLEDLRNVSGFAFPDFSDNWNRACGAACSASACSACPCMPAGVFLLV
jgi:hypothetical protein